MPSGAARSASFELGAHGGTPWSLGLNPRRLTDLDVAAGVVVGFEGVPPEATPRSGLTPLEVLRDSARDCLSRPPCVVAFSGGRDSSALLAVLADVARRDGLQPPVPVTARWSGVEATDETAWQEHVVAALRLPDWQVIKPESGLDLLGAEARGALLDHGLMWPPPAYAFLPMARAAAGGVLVTGEGGDEVFGEWPFARAWRPWRRRRRPTRNELRAVAFAVLPRRAKAVRYARREPPYQGWLTPDAHRTFADALARDLAADPVTWSGYLERFTERRTVRRGCETLRTLASAHGTTLVTPFYDHRFTKAMGTAGGRTGWGDRSETMLALFSGLLSKEILTRQTKATFGEVFWGPESRAFARSWDGHGLPSELVDPEALRRSWLEPLPVYGSALALHAAWLAGEGREAERT